MQRTIRDLLNDSTSAERDKAGQLLALAGHLGLVRQPALQPLPLIDLDDMYLVCRTVILFPALADGSAAAELLQLATESPVLRRSGLVRASLFEWRTVVLNRDERVRAAVAAGLTKHRISVLTGIGRSTIDRILASPREEAADGQH